MITFLRASFAVRNLEHLRIPIKTINNENKHETTRVGEFAHFSSFGI